MTQFLTPGISDSDFETRKGVELHTLPVGQLSTLKEFQDKHQQVFFTPAILYSWFYEHHIDFDPLFSDLPEKYTKHIRKLSLLPADIIDGFYGTQAYWNRTLWTIPSEIWVHFCKHIGGKGYFDTQQRLVVLFSMGMCNAEDVLAKLKGKQSGFISVAHIDLHTNEYSIVMSESLDTTNLSLAKMKPDPQIQAFASKFLATDSSAVNDLVIRPRSQVKIEPPEICSVSDLTKAQKRRFVELTEYYRQVFDKREVISPK